MEPWTCSLYFDMGFTYESHPFSRRCCRIRFFWVACPRGCGFSLNPAVNVWFAWF